ncbi:GNAT family N-acetyltransferase [Nocardiopsis chromatogenes]|uniref:GNAT family N-acetyltransferase n=1 Tax=Nocardiopsis chromatogenes TaxID=280239 RepID=UPI00036976AE|nr:GNAT family N-acetyltransferase [Nocardiopsis chromatogenes]
MGEPDTSAWLGETGTAWHTRALSAPDVEHLTALHTVDGATGTGEGRSDRAGDRAVELRRIVVASAHRGTGRGRELLEAVPAWAYERRGARGVWSDVSDVKADNRRARSLYEASGFVVRERRENAGTGPDGTAFGLVAMDHRPA